MTNSKISESFIFIASKYLLLLQFTFPQQPENGFSHTLYLKHANS